eukprot:3236897-Ditylum_brightwellii.AAC.1
MDTQGSLKLDDPKVEPKEPMIKQKIKLSTELIMFTLKAELVEFTEENEWKIRLQQVYVLKESQDEPRTTTIQ